MDYRRDLIHILKTIQSDLKRVADGVQQLANEPMVEVLQQGLNQSGNGVTTSIAPPQCPHCGTPDPVINVRQEEGRGHMTQWLLVGVCSTCGHDMYATPVQFLIARNRDEAGKNFELLNAERMRTSVATRPGNDI